MIKIDEIIKIINKLFFYMENYKASEELINVLLKNGFTEVTKEKHPLHFDKLITDGYDPLKMKRLFSINGHKRNFIQFDYTMIQARFREGVNSGNMKTEISTNELKSLITFYKLHFQTQNKMKRNGLSIFTLISDYNSIKKHPDFYKKDKSALLLVDIFEKITF